MSHSTNDYEFGNNCNPTYSQSRAGWNQNSNHNNNNMLNQSFGNSQVRGMKQSIDRGLVPVTIKQILLSPDPQPEEAFKIDGKTTHQISVIAIIESISPEMTHTQFILDDYGAKMQCKLWTSDDTDIKEMETKDIKVGVLARVIGKVDCFGHRKSINIHHIERVIDFNKMYMHGLECILAHEMNQMIMNQHIPKYKNKWNQFMRRSHDEHNQAQQELDNWRKERNTEKKNHSNRNNYNRFASPRNRNKEELGLDHVAKKVLNFLRLSQDNELGCDIKNIGSAIGEYNLVNIKNACKELANRGLIYDTIDDHYAFSGPEQNK